MYTSYGTSKVKYIQLHIYVPNIEAIRLGEWRYD